MENEGEKSFYKTAIPDLSNEQEKAKSKSIKTQHAKAKDKTVPEIQPVPYIQLFRFTSTKEKIYLFVGALAALVASTCFPILNVLFGQIAELMVELEKEKVDCINGTTFPQTTSATNSDSTEMDDFLDGVSTLSLYLAVAGVVQFLCGYLMISIFARVAELQVFRIRKLYLNALLRQNVGWFDTVQDTNFISRISEDMQKIQEAIGDKVALCVYYFFNSVVCLAIAFYYGWLLTLVVLSSTPVIALASVTMSSLQSKLTVKEQKAYGISGSASQEALTNIKTVMAFGAQQKEIERYEKNLVFAQRAGKKRGAVSALGTGVLWFLNYASYALAFWYGTKLIFDDQEKQCDKEPEYGTAVLLIVFFNVLTGSFNIGQSLSYLETFSVGRGAAANIYTVIDRTPEIDSYSDTGRNPKQRPTGKIEFKNIHFAYPSRPEVTILNGFNLTIRPGSTVALVGNSGNGKSTILQLLQRFYDPLEGLVYVDDTDIRDFNLNWYRSHIGYVGQEPVLFNTTIAENIRYGRDGITQEEIEEACRLSNALTFISKLPNKFETVVGDRGSQLSGGQKQRIAIARSLVKNPAILLLDEATSALDTQSEKIVQVALERASSGRTTLIVAHRLSTIRAADLIVSLQNGKVVEMGTHNELLAKKGLYFDLVTAQMSGHNEQQSSEEGESSGEKALGRLSTSEEIPIEDEEDALDITSTAEPVTQKSPDSKMPIVYRLLKLNMKEWPLITTGIIMSIAHGCILPLYAFFFGDFMGILALSDSDKAREEANYYAIVFLGIGIAAGVTIFGALISFSFAGEALTNRLRRLAFTAMMKQSTGWYDSPNNAVGKLVTRLSADAASVQGATGSRLGTVVQAFTTIAISTGLALYVLPKVGAVALSFVPFIIIAAYYSGKMIEAQQVDEKKATEEASKLAYQAVTNIRTVASLCKEKAFVQMYGDALLSPHVKALRHSHMLGFVYGLSQSLLYFAYASVMYYGGILIKDENVDYTKIFIIGEALIWTMLMLGQTLAFAPNYNKAKVAGARIMELLDTRPEMDLSPGVGLQIRSCEGHVSFDNVEFSYPTRPMSKILKGLNLKIEPHMHLGVCGPSGSGKSTCIQLILRFYDPTKGEVNIDNIDIARLNVNALRSQMALVAQEPSLFDRSLAENIAYGDNSREVPMTDIIEAARAANIHDFVASLPGGYETKVGQMGSQLSGGQKQRIAIARSLVRNPSILLLDEATSALDTESEKIVQATLEHASSGRTTFTIAHRLSSIQNCDKILVVNNGILSESGTHSELLSQRGIYYKLWKIQQGHEKSS